MVQMLKGFFPGSSVIQESCSTTESECRQELQKPGGGAGKGTAARPLLSVMTAPGSGLPADADLAKRKKADKEHARIAGSYSDLYTLLSERAAAQRVGRPAPPLPKDGRLHDMLGRRRGVRSDGQSSFLARHKPPFASLLCLQRAINEAALQIVDELLRLPLPEDGGDGLGGSVGDWLRRWAQVWGCGGCGGIWVGRGDGGAEGM